MADRYWVGGTGNWNDTARWSTGSGGASGASVPTSADNAIFDAASDAGAGFTVTVNVSSACANFTASAVDQVMTLAGSSTLAVAGSLTWHATNFTRTYTGNITFSATTTVTINPNGITLTTGSVTFNGVGGVFTLGSALTVGTTTTLTNGTIDLSASNYSLTTLIFASNNSNTRSINFRAGKIYVTGNNASVLQFNTPTNFTYSGTPDFIFTYTGSVGQRNINFGTSVAATEAITPNLYVTGGTDIIAIGSARTLDCTGFTGTLTTAVSRIFGNFTLNSGMTTTATASTTSFLATSGVQLVTTAGVTLNFPVTISSTGATVRLVDNLTVEASRLTTLTAGTFDLNGKAVSTGTFTSTGTTARVIAFGTNGSFTVVGSGATAWNTSGSNLTTTGTTSTISMTSGSAKTFVGGGYTYNATLNQGGAGTLTISGSNTVYDITATSVPSTITFTAGTTQTVTQFTGSGTSGNLLTLNSSLAGSTFTLSDVSGTNSVSYCSISDSTATGGATWNSYLTNGNVDGGGNIGWAFNAPVAYSYSTDIKLRSLTQRGRF